LILKTNKMRIAFTAAGTTWDSLIDSRFGRTEYIIVHDEETQELIVVDNNAVKNEAHGAGIATAKKIFELQPDVLITGHGPGENAANALRHIKVRIFIGAHNMNLRQAYTQYKNGVLKEI
jgi:predicted Fe-Mo cluster-binding NifX family protein